ncbi:hypothetical protein HBI56_048730 [Parastagonospora nodorum]|uniref:CFEM domain-containing protein n=1 Tax=Phaeosphaeria nodorum (strain SN15 / ATCC MYA-4574 / FGSC 10173) TaxID=321614 RepID=A0A7U2HX73_PHANO|nr:hypothetical protein HBH56_061650 [Parastagonospora nodorum]QRC91996.1 hypothetical protein JI435_021610 [Parastagonospora nodorum SN15]KAH3930945.1 hypothetical protein HBH54_105590 [Parastagonospora nodorum]KAH3954117.1 hypothetical protein HBH53_020280 [Parastagonospora nodorum]KAH3968099.1 hypothetical protein HBH51_133170 [Parastagonospora nodorum]
MRFSTASIFACAVAFVAAQDLSQIPSCALPCFASAVQGSGCGLSDTKCQCTTGNAKITESVTACAPSKCQADDLQKLVAAAAGICSAAGYPLQQASSAAAAASGAASTGMAMPSGSAMPSRSAMPSGNSSASGTMARPSMTPSASGSGTPAQSTGAAGANFVNGALVLAMGVLAL